jgi:hypothetical protein
MKGTLFSADFIKDANNNLRLLEFNTDTAFTNGALNHVDFSSFNTLITNLNISEVHVIYKQGIHTNFVDALTLYLGINNPSIILTFQKEDINTIYPTSVADSDSKFILRCAYDESAIFDSTYCKQKYELFKLFQENSQNELVAESFINTTDYQVDLLGRRINTDTSPDVAVKDLLNLHSSIEFYKIAGTGSIEDNFNTFINQIGSDKLVVNYYNTLLDPVHKATRSFNIIYGSNLDILNLTNVDVDAVFTKPTVIEYDTSLTLNLLDTKHYYEFTTNYPQFTSKGSYGGIFEEEAITDINGNAVKSEDTVIGDAYKSNFIYGAPDTDNPLIFSEWSHSGSVLPEGSFVTSSLLTNKVKNVLERKLISNITTEESASFRATGKQHLLIYDSGSDSLLFKRILDIDATEDYLIKDDGSLTKIVSNDIEILEGNHYTYLLDLENVDTYVLHDSGLNIKVVAHNACFPAGTRILLGDGTYKNIENIQDGDTLISYDTTNKKFTTGRVSKVNKSTQTDLIEITTDNGEFLTATLGHRIFTTNGWKNAGELGNGDILINNKGVEITVTNTKVVEGDVEVYHILNVGNDHTYFANDLLVHNFSGTISCFPAGTQITLSNGDTKNIEDIVVGDVVVSYNEESGIQEHKEVVKLQSPIHDDLVKYTFSNGSEITCTYDHPLYVNDLTLSSYKSEWTNERYDLPSVVSEIKVGDFVYPIDGDVNVEIISIEELPRVETQTYIFSVDGNRNFYANEILVHNK